MVIGAFPVAKLGVLLIRQVSKPIANVIKDNAKNSKFFRTYICMPPAQFYNWCEVKMKMWALNLGRPVTVPPLNEAMAIELGANLLGEFIIFAVGAGALLFEYNRQSNNEARKQEAQKQEKEELLATITEISFRLERQDAQIREMTRVLADVESHYIFRWHHKEQLGEYLPFDKDEPNQSPRRGDNDQQDFNGSCYNPQRNIVFKALNYLDTSLWDSGVAKTHIDMEDVEEPYVISPRLKQQQQ